VQEREKYMRERHKKIIASEAKYIHKQQNEMNALKKKIRRKFKWEVKDQRIEAQ